MFSERVDLPRCDAESESESEPEVNASITRQAADMKTRLDDDSRARSKKQAFKE